jgi:5-methylcytosine-specific restriction endonuclease McrA
MTSTAGDPRGTQRWKRIRAGLIAAAQNCAICGWPLNPTAPPRSRWRPSVDHIVSVSRRPDLAFELSNLRVVCTGCNSSRGASEGNRARKQGRPSW